MHRKEGNRRALVLDSVSLAICGSALDFIHTLQLPPQLEGGGHWQFLTNLALAVSIAVFSLGLLAHLFKSQRLFDVKNTLHSIAFSLELVVTVVYWPLRLFFINLIAIEGRLPPWWLDFAIHLWPFVALFIDYLFFMPPWKTKSHQAFIMISVLSYGYWYLLESLIDVNAGAVYPYPFLNKPDKERAIVFVIVGSIAYSGFLFAKYFYSLILGQEDLMNDKKKN